MTEEQREQRLKTREKLVGNLMEKGLRRDAAMKAYAELEEWMHDMVPTFEPLEESA